MVLYRFNNNGMGGLLADGSVMSNKDMKQLVLKPAVEAIKGGWVGKAALYENTGVGTIQTASERFNAYDNKQEAWDNLLISAQMFADNHNSNCNCGTKMIVGSY